MMNNTTIDEKIIEIRALESEVKRLQEQIDSIKNEIKSEMEKRNVDEIKTSLFSISYKDVISNRFDTTAFKKDNAEIYNYYLKESVSRRFTIK